MADPAELVVEIHIPLTTTGNPADSDDPFPWIDEITDQIVTLEEDGDVQMYDDGEEWGEFYVFFIYGAEEERLLAVARQLASLPGVPLGVYAMLTDTDAEAFGQGTRVDIS